MFRWLILLTLVGFFAYAAYDYYRAGFDTAPAIAEGDFLLSFTNGFRAVMKGIEDERDSRRYLGVPNENVSTLYDEAWSICRAPSQVETLDFEANQRIGPGARLDGVCEIDADGDVFIRGWVVTAPDLE
jgi:hypothetical protein